MSEKLRWGIIGTGRIAKKFAQGVKDSKRCELYAVGSRTQASADKFADEFDIPNRYDSYDAMLADEKVQAVYISLPHTMHAHWTIRCARAGKHILSEKPFAVNHAEAMTTLEHVRQHNVFFMEAFMYRCHSQTKKLVELIREGVIGQVRSIEATFAFNMGPKKPNNTEFRQTNAGAGGGIMDVGTYCTSMARLIAGAALGKDVAEPIEFKAVGMVREDDPIDLWSTAVLKFENNITASIGTGVGLSMRNDVMIYGESGRIHVPSPWFAGAGDGPHIIVHANGKEPQEFSFPGESLYGSEADAVAAHLQDKQAPSPHMTWADTLENMKALDRWRAEIGLIYEPETLEGLKVRPTGEDLKFTEKPDMAYGKLAGIDKPISRIVFGAINAHDRNAPYNFAMLDHFVECGGNCIDTAYVYAGGACERAVGRWFNTRDFRDQIVLIGKGAHTPHCTPEGLTRQLHETLERFGTDYIDLYFMHRDNEDVPVGEFVDVLNEHHKAGRIKVFGGSNWSIERLQAANTYAAENGRTGFAAVSNNFSLAQWNQPMWAGCVSFNDAASRHWLEETQFPIFAWSSQASGFFTGRCSRDNAGDPNLKAVVETWYNEDNFQRLDRARELAKKKNVSANHIALAYVLSQPMDIYALIGPRSIDETRTSIEAIKVRLSPEELTWLREG